MKGGLSVGCGRAAAAAASATDDAAIAPRGEAVRSDEIRVNKGTRR